MARETTMDMEMTFDTWWVALYLPGEPDSNPDLQRRHVEFLLGLMRDGRAVACGPFAERDDEDLRGMALLDGAMTRAELDALLAEDPAVASRRNRLSIQKWAAPAGLHHMGGSKP